MFPTYSLAALYIFSFVQFGFLNPKYLLQKYLEELNYFQVIAIYRKFLFLSLGFHFIRAKLVIKLYIPKP